MIRERYRGHRHHPFVIAESAGSTNEGRGEEKGSVHWISHGHAHTTHTGGECEHFCHTVAKQRL
jgi:hypothetical protein